MTLTEFLEKYPANNSGRFGEFVRIKREEKKLSVRAYAIELGISAVYLSDIENNNRPATTKIINLFKEKLSIQKHEESAFYDLAALSRETVEPEIIRYLIENYDARKAIKKAIDKNITGENLLEMVESQEENLKI